MKSIAYFNNKGGVGKTSLVFHLAWMFSEMGIRTLAVDLDPQANLTTMFLAEDKLEKLWPDDEHPDTILGAINPILRGTGDITDFKVLEINNNLGLIPGDLGLSRFEDKLSDAWPRCHNRDESAFRTMTAFYRLIANQNNYYLALIDVGPNLGAINRAALIAAEYVCVPLAPDLFSLQGLRNLGPALADWRTSWRELLNKAPRGLPVPSGAITPIGYVVMQHRMRDTRPVKAYQRWLDKIPSAYLTSVLNKPVKTSQTPVNPDSNRLAMLKHYASLMPMAMDANKPMFFLKPADGAIGAHLEAVRKCHSDFRQLAESTAKKIQLNLPS